MNLQDAYELMIACIEARLPAFLWGGPGLGKSDTVRQVASHYGWNPNPASRTFGLIDLRLSQYSDVDLRGLPHVEGSYSVWSLPSILPYAERDGERGVLFLDELPQAVHSVQNVGYQLILDRCIGDYQLPDGWTVIAAGNNSGDGGFQQKLASPLANRFAQHMEIEADIDLWANWATDNNIDPVIIGLLKYRSELLYQFDKNSKAFPTPRSWAMLSRLAPFVPARLLKQAAENCIGNGAAIEYYGYKDLLAQLPSLAAIIANPLSAPIPTNPGTLYAVCIGLARQLNAKTIKGVMQYLDRIPVEFAVMGVKSAIARDKSLESYPEFVQWAVKNQDAFKAS
ncbi:MAG TPA: hypothetical protein VF077_06170 [Nitrospiraceae bacterium]